MPAAQRLRLHGPLVLHPPQLIDQVDIEVIEAAAASPDETVEALHLVKEVGDTGRFRKRAEITAGPMHPVAALQNDLANLAIVDAVGQLLHRAVVTGHQS